MPTMLTLSGGNVAIGYQPGPFGGQVLLSWTDGRDSVLIPIDRLAWASLRETPIPDEDGSPPAPPRMDVPRKRRGG